MRLLPSDGTKVIASYQLSATLSGSVGRVANDNPLF